MNVVVGITKSHILALFLGGIKWLKFTNQNSVNAF